ncbi:uncharacterized protein H6S33_001761 [Morchella sextelata]|uniref:uncharacterized protein n=1 Tax=Morchella sextelata TaxID=1174677 RepID=UPI001D05640F|nr:uncharacterized protein H6S33_001761 [Morchella sextelata]KAH0608627.1 hypothetical protein H6S33_001761 [Morchella sextelata]
MVCLWRLEELKRLHRSRPATNLDVGHYGVNEHGILRSSSSLHSDVHCFQPRKQAGNVSANPPLVLSRQSISRAFGTATLHTGWAYHVFVQKFNFTETFMQQASKHAGYVPYIDIDRDVLSIFSRLIR